ncbi:MAG: cytochrome c [Gammaproteobacteria bacterium]|nr:cytochrome c [Gammaproteobacteria bacterium]
MNVLMRRAAAVCAVTLAVSAAPAQSPGDGAVGPRLPAELRALLIEEMRAVLDASGNILDALVRGQDERVAESAQAIHDSFIMARQMTEADREALHAAVPHEFIERDEAFHELSLSLAEAARAGDRPRQRELFADMLEACVDCHTAHATDRFPELAEEAQAGRAAPAE